jgi:hypothetical protein
VSRCVTMTCRREARLGAEGGTGVVVEMALVDASTLARVALTGLAARRACGCTCQYMGPTSERGNGRVAQRPATSPHAARGRDLVQRGTRWTHTAGDDGTDRGPRVDDRHVDRLELDERVPTCGAGFRAAERDAPPREIRCTDTATRSASAAVALRHGVGPRASALGTARHIDPHHVPRHPWHMISTTTDAPCATARARDWRLDPVGGR